MADDNVIDLKGKPAFVARLVNPDIVKMLRECLAAAEEGRVVQCAVVFRQDDGEVDHCVIVPNGISVDALIGRLRVAEVELSVGVLWPEQPFR